MKGHLLLAGSFPTDAPDYFETQLGVPKVVVYNAGLDVSSANLYGGLVWAGPDAYDALLALRKARRWSLLVLQEDRIGMHAAMHQARAIVVQSLSGLNHLRGLGLAGIVLESETDWQFYNDLLWSLHNLRSSPIGGLLVNREDTR